VAIADHRTRGRRERIARGVGLHVGVDRGERAGLAGARDAVGRDVALRRRALLTFAAAPAATATATATAAVGGIACRRAGGCARSAASGVGAAARAGEDRLIVVVFVVEELGSARREVGAKRVFARGDERGVVIVVVVCGSGDLGAACAGGSLDLERVDLGALAVLGVELGFVAALFTGRAATLLLLAVPLAQGKNARLHADDGRALVFLLQQRGEPGTHGDLGALAHVAEEVLLDGELRDLLVVEGLAGDAQHFGCGFRKRHVRLPGLECLRRPPRWASEPLLLQQLPARGPCARTSWW
jgi:hypothetical protein